MEMTKGEFVDRTSILWHKAEKIGEKCYGEFIKYITEFLKIGDKKLIDGLKELYKVNGEIWKLESDIRKGRERNLGLKEVGKRALKIRDWNKERIKIQNKINKECGEFLNIKKDHASE